MIDQADLGGLNEFFEANHWDIVDVLSTEPRNAELLPVDDLGLGPSSRAYLDNSYADGIYRHQKEALSAYLDGKNVCLVTGTASGKSLVFQCAALDLISNDPKARVMAIYPMKALGNEQQDRWQATFEAGGVNGHIGRIDGNVPPGFRLGVLERSQVIVFTPDIIHAWLFSNLKEPAVIEYLRRVKLIVVDEIHAYSGVFGSNAAFLFRRLEHIFNLLGTQPTFICASATIAHPADHLKALLGQNFEIIGPERDTSPRFPLKVILTRPTGEDRFLDGVVHLLEFLTQHTSSRFIAFVDSRKQVELISSILNRLLREEKNKQSAEEGDEEAPKRAKGAGRGRWGSRGAPASSDETREEEDVEGEVTGVLQTLNVLPYRAGYEDHDRRQIQERLAQGTLNGVVSTSALELGLDIANLDTCVLIGVPSSATSLQQRIGRIGRRSPGKVIVVNGGDMHDQIVFSNSQNFFARPLTESTLYLENEHIQYIHALCLVRPGGEHDQAASAAGKKNAPTQFESQVSWPENFIQLCQSERAGRPLRHLMSLKFEARDRPNYTFPLRDVESQFKVERKDGPNVSSLGSLSFGQLMREAYPGAIYYYATIPYRVTRVSVKGKTVQVRHEKRYTTQPQKTSPGVFPRMTSRGVDKFYHQDQLVCLECSLLVRESIKGVIEQRGRNVSHYPYPLSRDLGFYQDQPYFSRNFFTTGVILSHPSLSEIGVSCKAAASILYEAFMLKVPFDRQDIGAAADGFRSIREPIIQVNQPFLTIYDQTYGSLRLSRRFLDPQVMGQVLVEACMLGAKSDLNLATLKALANMAGAVFHQDRVWLEFASDAEENNHDPLRWERIVLPGSKGLMVRTNEEFQVMRILNTPGGLSYEGTPSSMTATAISVMPLLTDVAEIPGESQVGWYDTQSGNIEPILSEESLQVKPVGTSDAPPMMDPDWLSRLVVTYFDPAACQVLADELGIDAPRMNTISLWVEGLVNECARKSELTGLLDILLKIYLETMKPDEGSPAVEAA